MTTPINTRKQVQSIATYGLSNVPLTPGDILRRIDDEPRATKAFYAWLELNRCRTARDAVELLESTNDNPNIRPLPEGAY